MKTLQKTYTGKYAPNPLEFDYWIDLTADAKGSSIKTYNGTGWVEISNNGSFDGSELTDQRLRAIEETVDNHTNQLQNVYSVKVESGGIINLSGISAMQLSGIMNQLSEVGIKLYLIGDSNGNLPSSQKTITVEGIAKLILFGKTESFGVSVGDILAVTRYSCKIIPLNDAKPSTDDFPGADGLETVWDKTQINKIAGIESTANAALPRTDRLPSLWSENMNNALETGVYPWCTLGRPEGSTGAYTCIVNRTSTNDGNYDTIEQTAYGREAELGRIFKRIIFYKSDGTDTQYGEWKEITGNGVLAVSSVDELPNDVENGTLAVVYSSRYVTELSSTVATSVVSCDADVEDFADTYHEIGITESDFGKTIASIVSLDIEIEYSIYIEGGSSSVQVILKTESSLEATLYDTYGDRFNDGISAALTILSSPFTIIPAEGYEEIVYKLLPKLSIADRDVAEIYIKCSDGWINPIELVKEEIIAADRKEEEHRFLEYQVSLIPNSGVTYNEETGYWSCNDITDITDDEMKEMVGVYASSLSDPFAFASSNIRTNIPMIAALYSDHSLTKATPRLATKLQKLRYSNGYLARSYEEAIQLADYRSLRLAVGMNVNFAQNSRVLAVENVLNLAAQTSLFNINIIRKIFLLGLRYSLKSASEYLHYDSLRYMVEKAANTSAIQITVHADTYSYLTGTAEPTEEVGGTAEEWQALVTTATEKNITFATA